MTRSTSPDLNKARATAALTGPARQVHLAVLTRFAATGQAPDREELDRIASYHGAVLAELAERDVLAFTPAGQIRAAYPFSPVPTPIQLSWLGSPNGIPPSPERSWARLGPWPAASRSSVRCCRTRAAIPADVPHGYCEWRARRYRCRRRMAEEQIWEIASELADYSRAEPS